MMYIAVFTCQATMNAMDMDKTNVVYIYIGTHLCIVAFHPFIASMR